jgi:hypothetical protein
MQLGARVSRGYGVQVPIQMVFDAPTLGEFAARIDAARASGDSMRPREDDRAEIRT